MDFLALVITGFWPAIAVSSSAAVSRILMFWMASPSPMLRTIFFSRGTCIGLVYLKVSISFGTTSVW